MSDPHTVERLLDVLRQEQYRVEAEQRLAERAKSRKPLPPDWGYVDRLAEAAAARCAGDQSADQRCAWCPSASDIEAVALRVANADPSRLRLRDWQSGEPRQGNAVRFDVAKVSEFEHLLACEFELAFGNEQTRQVDEAEPSGTAPTAGTAIQAPTAPKCASSLSPRKVKPRRDDDLHRVFERIEQDLPGLEWKAAWPVFVGLAEQHYGCLLGKHDKPGRRSAEVAHSSRGPDPEKRMDREGFRQAWVRAFPKRKRATALSADPS